MDKTGLDKSHKSYKSSYHIVHSKIRHTKLLENNPRSKQADNHSYARPYEEHHTVVCNFFSILLYHNTGT